MNHGDEKMLAATMAQRGTPSDEGEVIGALIAQGSHREALERCTRCYAAPLGRLCMALTGSQAEAEELTQETLIAAYDGFAAYRGDGSVRSWLYGIARRICGRHNEMKNRRQARLRLVHDTGKGLDVGELHLERERAIRIRAALQDLKPSEREAVVLRYEAGLSFKEVAQACGVDEAAARKRVSRALARLRETLSDV